MQTMEDVKMQSLREIGGDKRARVVTVHYSAGKLERRKEENVRVDRETRIMGCQSHRLVRETRGMVIIKDTFILGAYLRICV